MGRGIGPFLLAAASLLAVGIHYTTHLRVSGDEPHYLIMAQSLWRQHDLDLRDNYAQGDYLEYTPGPVQPHYGAPRIDGRPYPAHGVGLPLLLAPVYALGGRVGCAALLSILAAALCAQVYRLALPLGEEAAWLAFGATLGPPLFFYSFLIYTEVLSALLIFLVWRFAREGGDRSAVIAALAIAALPWVHVKMIGAAIVLALASWTWMEGRARKLYVLLVATGAGLFLAYHVRVFGTASPLAVYGGVPKDLSGSPLRALAGLALDRSFGLLPYAPFYLLVGRVLWGDCRAVQRVWAWLLGISVLAPVVFWRMWWGGQCPPGRMLVPLIPLAALAIARRSLHPRGLMRWRWTLLVLGAALAMRMSLQPGELLLLNRGDRPTRIWAALAHGFPLERYLPSMVTNAPADQRVLLVWVAALVVLLLLDALATKNARIDGWFRGLGLPLLMLLIVTVGVERWARAAAPEFTSGVCTSCPGVRGAGAPRLSSTRGAASASAHARGRVALRAAAPARGPLRSTTQDGF